jgi:hypothetical protein
VTGGWGRLHMEELRNLYVTPSAIRVSKLRRMRWEEHVARVGQMQNGKHFS